MLIGRSVQMGWIGLVALAAPAWLAVTGPGRAATIDLSPFEDDTTPLANPHKGWYHHYFDNGLHKYLIQDDRELTEFPGMDHLYLRLAWSYLEPREGTYTWDVIDRTIDTWTERGLGIAFRISCRETGRNPEQQQYATPRWVVEAGARGGNYYKGEQTGPDGPWEPDFDDPVFLEKLENFLTAFGRRYDGKPWLRYVDIGSIGDWGEGHTFSGSRTAYTAAQRAKHIDLYCAAFPTTQLVLTDDFVHESGGPEGQARLRALARERGITYRDDSILVDYYIGAYPESDTVRSPAYFDEVYQQRPTILELEHYTSVRRLGNWLGKPGSSMARHGQGRDGADFMRGAVDRLHATYIGYHGPADVWWRENPDLTGELLNRCGYWYFLHRVSTPDRIRPGRTWTLALTWLNRGAAPAYDPFNLVVRLDGPASVDTTLPAGNRSWMPGIPGEEHMEIAAPPTLPPGRYRLKLKLVAPRAGRTIRLALDSALLDPDGFYTIPDASIEVPGTP